MSQGKGRRKMKKITWKEKFQYHFDNIMSKGTASLIGILFGITALVVIIAGVIVGLSSGTGVGKATWMSLMHAIDAGTLAGDSENFLFMLLMTVVTICGLFITSMLIGILNTGIEEKMTSLQKGKSHVLEKNHVILLGFNEDAINILSELITANENHKNQVIVVMDDMDKTEMEDAIHQRITDLKTTRIICRSGMTDRFTDLSICSLETCRSVILNIDDDARTIKSILACVHLLENSNNRDAYITAMIRDPENLEAASIAGGGRAEILYFKQTIARLMAQATRQPGISTVFTNLLSYDGDEIYVEPVPGAEGQTLEQLNLRLPRSLAIGISGKNGPRINPPKDTRVQPGDSLILIEEDDGVSSLMPQPAQPDRSLFGQVRMEEKPQCTLILGNGDLLELVLRELDGYVVPGSQVIAAAPDWDSREQLSETLKLENMEIRQYTCDIFSSRVLRELLKSRPQNIMILTDSRLEDEDADAKTLQLLLQLSNLSNQDGLEFTVASEMRKVENQELAKMTKVNDFVISSNITALMMTQISQNREQRLLLEDLLDEDGSEFYRKPISHYVKTGEAVDFYTLISAAAQYGEVAVGYQKVENGKYRTVCNPLKSQKITFTNEDALIVIAED